MRKEKAQNWIFRKLMRMFFCLFSALVLSFTGILNADAAEEAEEILVRYEEYEQRFAAIEISADIEANGFDIIETQVFPVILETFGEEEVIFTPAMEPQYHRLALFIVGADGSVLYKTNQLETNTLQLGKMEQPTKDIAAVSFQDANLDGLTDIILITQCVNDAGEYAGKTYKTGDILFQKEGGFYRDYRISDKINRFSMNKSATSILAFVRDGNSMEFLYTATTLEELLDHGFNIIEEQCYYRSFEKLGRLRVVPGVAELSEYDIFMIYLINEQGHIVWSFQPMEDYDNLYSLKGMTGKDVDGDGMKDLVVLARYSYDGPDGKIIVESDCAIYYQRTSGFDIDAGFEEYYQCTDENTLEELVIKIREYWGWKTEVPKESEETND